MKNSNPKCLQKNSQSTECKFINLYGVTSTFVEKSLPKTAYHGIFIIMAILSNEKFSDLLASYLQLH